MPRTLDAYDAALAFAERHAFQALEQVGGKIQYYCRCMGWSEIVGAFERRGREQAKDGWMRHVQRERERERTV